MNKTRRRQLSYSINTTLSNPIVEARSRVHCNATTCSCSARGKCYDAQSQEQFIPVMLNLFQHLTNLACNLFTDKILKLSWIIRDLAGVTSRSTLRARLHRCPTENPLVQDDIIKNSCNKLFNHSTFQLFNCEERGDLCFL